MRTYTVTNYYLEVEAGNIRPAEKKYSIICNCGGKVFRPKPNEELFGKKFHCPKCGDLLFVISKKIQWTEYISGKEEGNEKQ